MYDFNVNIGINKNAIYAKKISSTDSLSSFISAESEWRFSDFPPPNNYNQNICALTYEEIVNKINIKNDETATNNDQKNIMTMAQKERRNNYHMEQQNITNNNYNNTAKQQQEEYILNTNLFPLMRMNAGVMQIEKKNSSAENINYEVNSNHDFEKEVESIMQMQLHKDSLSSNNNHILENNMNYYNTHIQHRGNNNNNSNQTDLQKNEGGDNIQFNSLNVIQQRRGSIIIPKGVMFMQQIQNGKDEYVIEDSYNTMQEKIEGKNNFLGNNNYNSNINNENIQEIEEEEMDIKTHKSSTFPKQFDDNYEKKNTEGNGGGGIEKIISQKTKYKSFSLPNNFEAVNENDKKKKDNNVCINPRNRSRSADYSIFSNSNSNNNKYTESYYASLKNNEKRFYPYIEEEGDDDNEDIDSIIHNRLCLEDWIWIQKNLKNGIHFSKNMKHLPFITINRTIKINNNQTVFMIEGSYKGVKTINTQDVCAVILGKSYSPTLRHTRENRFPDANCLCLLLAQKTTLKETQKIKNRRSNYSIKKKTEEENEKQETTKRKEKIVSMVYPNYTLRDIVAYGLAELCTCKVVHQYSI